MDKKPVLSGKERITKILKHEPVDRIGLYEHFWGDTINDWTAKGFLKENESVVDHFGFDIISCGTFNMTIDMNFTPETICEDEDTITQLDGNGATLRRHKKHDTTPEHIDFRIKERSEWDKFKHLLKPDRERINFEGYRYQKKLAQESNKFFTWSGANVFELMHPVCGHENMLIGMALDPDWIMDMVYTFSRLLVDLQKILFDEEGYPDGIWYYEDMGFKGKPFFSPQMYIDIIKPGHKYTIDFAKEHDMPVIMHSCGFIEPLLPHMIDAGIDCLQVIEIKAGMDLLKLHALYGDKIAFMGGIDVRTLYTNDKEIIDAELMSKIPIVKNGYNYVLHSDHSIPKTVDYEIYKYFIKKGLELGTY
ncbi:MAG: uroporphyrinogen decarboxylase family protein [Saccharofermentanales bacterium]